MKPFFKILLCFALLLSAAKWIQKQTEGFQVDKLYADSFFQPEWEIENPSSGESALNQPFYFLGSGVQCYAFVGKDQKTVLKVFKHYQHGLSSKVLKKLPLPTFLENWRKKILLHREERMKNIFSSSCLAYHNLFEQTGIFYLNINPKQGKYPSVTLYDKLGIAHVIDLNCTPFLLQKKADLLFSYLEDHIDETKTIIDALFSCIIHRSTLGIATSDPSLHKNFGIYQGSVLEIDVASFKENPAARTPLFSKRELLKETKEFRQWISEHIPELSDYFEHQLLEAIRAIKYTA